MYLCGRVSILLLSTIFRLYFGTVLIVQGQIQDFKLGGGALKKNWVFRVKNHDFMPKNHIFSNFRGVLTGCTPPGSAPVVGYFFSHFITNNNPNQLYYNRNGISNLILLLFSGPFLFANIIRII